MLIGLISVHWNFSRITPHNIETGNYSVEYGQINGWCKLTRRLRFKNSSQRSKSLTQSKDTVVVIPVS